MNYLLTSVRLIGALALLTLAVGCASTGQTQNLFTAAGLKTVVATTSQQQQRLKALPPNKWTLVQQNGKTYYVYADPAHHQMYIGNKAQYHRYQELRWASTPQPFID